MLPFGYLISEAGFDLTNYPTLAEIPVELYDRKNREIGEEDFHFNANLFKNEKSKKQFFNLLETKSRETVIPTKIVGKLNDDALILHFPEGSLKFFPIF